MNTIIKIIIICATFFTIIFIYFIYKKTLSASTKKHYPANPLLILLKEELPAKNEKVLYDYDIGFEPQDWTKKKVPLVTIFEERELLGGADESSDEESPINMEEVANFYSWRCAFEKVKKRSTNFNPGDVYYISGVTITDNDKKDFVHVESSKAYLDNGVLMFQFTTKKFTLNLNPFAWPSIQIIEKTYLTFRQLKGCDNKTLIDVTLHTKSTEFLNFFKNFRTFFANVLSLDRMRIQGFWLFTKKEWIYLAPKKNMIIEYDMLRIDATELNEEFESGNLIPDAHNWEVLTDLLVFANGKGVTPPRLNQNRKAIEIVK